MTTEKELTVGEMFVGLDFNPGGNPTVTKLKQLFAEVIDVMAESHPITPSIRQRAVYDQAVMSTLAAQMMAVKAVTFRY